MRALQARTVGIVTFLLLAVAVTHAGPTTLLVASIATVALASFSVGRVVVLAGATRAMTVGARARAHQESLSGMPAPQHPRTAGRPRTRAPSQPSMAA